MRPLPPDRIDLGDLVARWMRPTDVEALVDATRSSFDELHAWMPWATDLDQMTVEAITDFYERTQVEMSEHRSVAYLLTVPPDERPVGTVGAHARIDEGGVEIGYWVRTDTVGRGLVTRTVSAVTDAMLALPDVDHVEIHCDETNARSAAVPAGWATSWSRSATAPQASAETGREMIWRRTEPIGPGERPAATTAGARRACLTSSSGRSQPPRLGVEVEQVLGEPDQRRIGRQLGERPPSMLDDADLLVGLVAGEGHLDRFGPPDEVPLERMQVLAEERDVRLAVPEVPPSRNDISPVSSRTSRRAVSAKDSSGSRPPPGVIQYVRGRPPAIHDDVAVVDDPQEQQSVVGIEQHHSAAAR